MANLDDLIPDVKQLTDEELQAKLLEIRANRRVKSAEPKKQKGIKSSTKKKADAILEIPAEVKAAQEKAIDDFLESL